MALYKDFTATFATNVNVDFPSNREEGFVVKTFEGGKSLGVEIDEKTGVIKKVGPGQAKDQGITEGMLMRMIDMQPYTQEELRKKSTEASFEAVFLKCPGPDGKDKGGHEAQMISRTSSSLPEDAAFKGKVNFPWLEDWNPSNSENDVADYLSCFGLEAKSSDDWQQCPSEC